MGRYIMVGVLILHEILHDSHKKNGALFKVEFEKAYDNVNWSFLCKIMKAKDFLV